MKSYLLFGLIIFSAGWSFAQSTNKSNTAIDTTEKKKTSLTLAALYGSNITYYGQTSSQTLPFALGYAKLSFPTGLYLAGQTYKLLNSEPGISGAAVTVGYGFNLSKKLSGDLNYSRSFYPDSSQLLQSANQDVASASLNYDWQWLTTGLTADYAIGSESAFYTTFNVSKYIDLGLSFSSKDYLTLEPSFEIIGGTQRFEIPAPKKALLSDVIGRGKKQRTITTTEFDLIAYNFTLPLAYNRAKYSFEASYQGTVLSRSISDSQKLQSFFNLGFYYTF